MAALDSSRNSVQLHQSKYECNSVVVSATVIALAAITILVIGILAQQGMLLPYFSQSASWSLIGTGIGILAAEFLFLTVQICKRVNTRSPLFVEGGEGNAALHVQRNPDVLSASVQSGSRVEVTTVRQKGLERFFCCCPGSSNTLEHTDAIVYSSLGGGDNGGSGLRHASGSSGTGSSSRGGSASSLGSSSFGSGTSGTKPTSAPSPILTPKPTPQPLPGSSLPVPVSPDQPVDHQPDSSLPPGVLPVTGPTPEGDKSN